MQLKSALVHQQHCGEFQSSKAFPSAYSIFRRNFPEANVYNQCVNTMLRHCVKQHDGHATEPLEHIHDSSIPFPESIKPGDVEVLVGGYPW